MTLKIKDARYLQIGALTLMLISGIFFRDFPIGVPAIAVVLGTVLIIQFLIGVAFVGLPASSLLSALISGISLLLLCRSQSLLILAFASAIAILSKFVLRFRGKHFFNPTNFGILVPVLLTGGAWISPGQWGDDFLLGFWILLMGLSVVISARRSDIAWMYLGFLAFLFAGRVWYLGQPWAVLWHQLNNGSLLLFTFFMISDPRSTPNSVSGRILFSVSVACLTFVMKFYFFHPQAPLWALFFLSPLTIFIDYLLPAPRFEWRIDRSRHEVSNKMGIISSFFDATAWARVLWVLRREGRR